MTFFVHEIKHKLTEKKHLCDVKLYKLHIITIWVIEVMEKQCEFFVHISQFLSISHSYGVIAHIFQLNNNFKEKENRL